MIKEYWYCTKCQGFHSGIECKCTTELNITDVNVDDEIQKDVDKQILEDIADETKC